MSRPQKYRQNSARPNTNSRWDFTEDETPLSRQNSNMSREANPGVRVPLNVTLTPVDYQPQVAVGRYQLPSTTTNVNSRSNIHQWSHTPLINHSGHTNSSIQPAPRPRQSGILSTPPLTLRPVSPSHTETIVIPSPHSGGVRQESRYSLEPGSNRSSTVSPSDIGSLVKESFINEEKSRSASPSQTSFLAQINSKFSIKNPVIGQNPSFTPVADSGHPSEHCAQKFNYFACLDFLSARYRQSVLDGVECYDVLSHDSVDASGKSPLNDDDFVLMLGKAIERFRTSVH